MSTPPPTSNRSVAENPGGDGVEIRVDDVRGGQRTGRMVWILLISIGAIAVLFAAYLIMNARHMQAIPQQHDLNARDVSTFRTPPPSPRQTPDGNAQ